MKKRTFIRTLGAGGMGLVLRGSLPGGTLAEALGQNLRRKNWAWVGKSVNTTDDNWKKIFGAARRANIDAVIPEVYDGQEAYYASTRHPVASDWLARLLPIAKAEGLECHAWMWSMPCNQEEVRRLHPEWFCVNRNGESAWEKPAYVDYYRFLCPSRPEVWEFLKGTVTELGSIAEIAGIHLDYIRFPDVILAKRFQLKYGIVQDREYPAYDYCYCEVCREGFKSMTGVDPLKLPDPTANPEWRQFRYDLITRLVNTVLVPAGRQCGKIVTAAVFPNWESVRQQWTAWDLDGVMPMLYHGFYDENIDWIRRHTARGVEHLKERTPVYSGLFVSHLTPTALKDAYAASIAGGARGVALFDAQSMTDEHWESLRYVVSQ